MFPKESFSYISENPEKENPEKNYLYFRKRNFVAPSLKTFL